ncbi:MAG: hypothetical protein GX485_08850 [Clostridiales bacterium]|nr:hypothetical protein [Clostridiales bacterium]
MNFNLLTVAFTSLLGNVTNEDIDKSLRRMGLGMLGIFIVMLLIYLVTIILNNTTKDKNDEE